MANTLEMRASEYQQRKQAGLCTLCGVRPAREGVVSCVVCRPSKNLKLIEEGELVPNDVAREALLDRLDRDPEFSYELVCHRLVDLGYPKFARLNKGRLAADTTRLKRKLGIVPRASSYHKGERYANTLYTTHAEYDFLVALAEALDLDPVDLDV